MDHDTASRTVGHVAALWRFPVKSMAGEPLEAVDVGWHGLAGDRRWAFVRDGTSRVGFPWLSIRQHAAMARHQPYFVEPDRPDTSPTRVRTPDGGDFDVADPALAEAMWPDGARLLKLDRGTFDSFPLSLITTQTIDWLGARIGRVMDARRFRMNLVIRAAEARPFQEDEWLGHTLRIGGVRLRVDRRDGRCVVITTDPDTLERDPAILRLVAAERDGCLGVYASTVERGRVACGDAVRDEISA